LRAEAEKMMGDAAGFAGISAELTRAMLGWKAKAAK
jgi:hypothetical protein